MVPGAIAMGGSAKREDRDTAFQEVLLIGYSKERSLPPQIRGMLRRSAADSPQWNIWKNWGWGEQSSKCI
jgi:hypothetical protein